MSHASTSHSKSTNTRQGHDWRVYKHACLTITRQYETPMTPTAHPRHRWQRGPAKYPLFLPQTHISNDLQRNLRSMLIQFGTKAVHASPDTEDFIKRSPKPVWHCIAGIRSRFVLQRNQMLDNEPLNIPAGPVRRPVTHRRSKRAKAVALCQIAQDQCVHNSSVSERCRTSVIIACPCARVATLPTSWVRCLCARLPDRRR